MKEFAGLVLIQTDDGRTTIRLDGNSSKVTVGVNGLVQQEDPTPGSSSAILDPIFTDRVSIDGAAGTITVNGTDGSPLLILDGSKGNGQFVVRDGSGRDVLTFTSANAQLLVGATDHGGDLIVRDSGGRDVLDFNSATAQLFVGAAGNGGDMIARDAEGREVLTFNSANAQLFVGAAGNEGDLIVRDAEGRDVLNFSGESGRLTLGAAGNEGDLVVCDAGGREVLTFDGDSAQLFVGAAGNEGDIYVRNDNGDDTIHLNGSSGDIVLSNADAAEDFELAATAEGAPGAVMVLTCDGTLQPCAAAYDRKVVGVVAGAGAYRPAIILNRRPGNDARQVPISVIGRAACQADATYGVIEVGDLLTSSPTVGAAMRVTDVSQAFGAVIGKAMTPLREGIGLVDIVVGLH